MDRTRLTSSSCSDLMTLRTVAVFPVPGTPEISAPTRQHYSKSERRRTHRCKFQIDRESHLQFEPGCPRAPPLDTADNQASLRRVVEHELSRKSIACRMPVVEEVLQPYAVVCRIIETSVTIAATIRGRRRRTTISVPSNRDSSVAWPRASSISSALQRVVKA